MATAGAHMNDVEARAAALHESRGTKFRKVAAGRSRSIDQFILLSPSSRIVSSLFFALPIGRGQLIERRSCLIRLRTSCDNSQRSLTAVRNTMFHLRRAAARAVTLAVSSSQVSRSTTCRMITSKPSASLTTFRSFTQFRPRFSTPPGQEEAATSETTDTVPETSEGTPAPEPVSHEQEAAATSETTDQLPSAAASSAPAQQDHGYTLYVGNMPFDTMENEIRDLFSRYGDVKAVKLATHPDGRFKGFSFVTFANKSDSEEAAKRADLQDFRGRSVRVRVAENFNLQERSRSQGTNSPTTSLYIGNISFETTDKELNDLFRDIRDVTDVRVAIDRRTGQPRGFAHADFTSVEAATKGLQQLTDKDMHGRRLRLDYSQPAKKNYGSAGQ